MLSYIWPLGLVVLSNTVYQICAKSSPEGMHPLAALTVTYFIGMITSGILYLIMNHGDANLLREYTKLNWAPCVLGIVIVGLEVGWIYVYKAGWQVSSASLVGSIALSVVLIFVGALLYKEGLTWNKVVGVIICIVGLYFINHEF